MKEPSREDLEAIELEEFEFIDPEEIYAESYKEVEQIILHEGKISGRKIA